MLTSIKRLTPLLFIAFTACTAMSPRAPVSNEKPVVTTPRINPAPSVTPPVVTVPIDTGLESAPKQPLDSLPAQEASPALVPDINRPADATSSPYPASGDLLPSPGATTAIEPVIEPALPAIDYQPPPDPAPVRTLTPRIGEKLFTQSAPPAVAALESDIESKFHARSYGDAAAQIDRALRIQPKNPELWHVLAEIRLRQNQPALAEDLAKKSNSLAKTNLDLVKSNWRIIADARRQQGDGAGAQDALEKAW